MKRTTLSFLTESKASHVSLSSIRRVTITLLVMLLTTASAWAQDGPVIPTPKITKEIIPMNGGTVTAPEQAKMGTQVQFTVAPAEGYKIKSVSLSDPGIYDLAVNAQTGQYSFTIRSSDVTITVVFEENFKIINSLKYVITNEAQKQAKLVGYEGDKPEGILDILANVKINNIIYSVTSIRDEAFKDCYDLESVTIPTSVKSIGYSAFHNCEKLQSVTIPNSVTSIGMETFSDCSSLQSVTIPNSVTSIGNYAFSGCSSLESVTIPTSVTSIGNNAFEKCSSLTSIIVEEGNTYYDSRNNCNAIIETKSNTLILGCKNTIIPNSVTSIGNGAFQNSGITSVTIPNSVTSIGGDAFAFCSNLASATIPNSVTSIGGGAFVKCSSLESVTIPNSVTSIGDGAFKECNKLTSVILNSNPKIIGNAFDNTPATVTMNLTASNIDGNKWTTFYNEGYNFQADGNTTVYKGTVDGSSLVLTEVADRIVNRGTAVILKSSGNPVMTLTESDSNDTNGNDLRGRSDRTLRTDVIANISDANAIYTMGNTSVGFGFHRYTGEYVPAGKAFLPLYTSDGAKAQSLTIVFAIGATGINSVYSDSNVQNDWFSLDGTRLSGKPSHPGIYVNGKKKIVIK